MSRLGVQSQPKGVYHLEDCVEVGTAFTGERFVKAFTGQAGVTSHLPHAPGACNIAQRLGDSFRYRSWKVDEQEMALVVKGTIWRAPITPLCR